MDKTLAHIEVTSLERKKSVTDDTNSSNKELSAANEIINFDDAIEKRI